MPHTTDHDVMTEWVQLFSQALSENNQGDILTLFDEEAVWRDILSFTWDFTTRTGSHAIAEGLLGSAQQGSSFVIDPHPREPHAVVRAGVRVVEAFVNFETAVGWGRGVVRLTLVGDTWKATSLLTTLKNLKGFEERRGKNRPHNTAYSRTFGGANWLDQRIEEQKYSDRQPEVLIVGGGQAGLSIGARLRTIGVDALLVEKLPQVGDVWRNRYASLTLHNETWAGSLPYLEFPDTWPTYLPKDKLAGFMEYYAEAMELNVWNETVFRGATYDAEAGHWVASVERAGEQITLNPKHVIMCTGGVSGVRNIPQFPGLEEFQGQVLHSSEYTSGTQYEGQRVLVVGTGTSAHDVAQDLYSLGAKVSIMQRTSTTVVGLEPSGVNAYAVFSEGLPIEDADLVVAASSAYPTLIRGNQILTKRAVVDDAELLDGLRSVGFRLDNGEDETGWHLKYMRRGGGYYINVGCSDLIIDGEIGLVQYDDVDRLTENALVMKDGVVQEFDTVVFGTGYLNQIHEVAKFFGEDVAARVGPIWGFDENGELRNVWRRTEQQGLWFHAGSLANCRSYSRYLAMLVKADLESIPQ